MNNALKATAYHEAGHVVARWRFGCPISQVTITPAEDYLGMATGDSPLQFMDPDWDASPEVDQAMKEAVVISLAGPAAQKRFDLGSWQDYHGSGDFDSATNVLLRLGGTSEMVNAISDELSTQAENLVERHWSEISVVAEALLEQHDLDGDTARLLLEAFTGEVVPTSPLFMYMYSE